MDGKSKKNRPPPASEASAVAPSKHSKRAGVRAGRERDIVQLIQQVEEIRLKLGFASSQATLFEEEDLGL